MALTIGIVGLPNVGKSTLFNALTKNSVLAANYPFATIEPNVGVVNLPDERLDTLAGVFGSERTIPASVSFVDIAGIVKGASEGEGLGNQFLSHIREADAIAEVVRGFADPDVLEWAFNKRVALASPVSVWSVMKTVAFAWQQDALTQDAQTLFETGRELHNRLGTLANHLGTLGRSIQSTVSNYNKFLGTLERRVIPSTRKLSLLGDGEGMPDSFPGIEDSVRELSAGELTEESDD